MTEFQLLLLEWLAWFFYFLMELITLFMPFLILAILGCILWTVIKYKRGDFDE